MNQEEIEWMLFEFAEGNLSGEEYLYWEKQIQENPEIAQLFQQLQLTYLTGSALPQVENQSNLAVTHPLSNWGNNLVYKEKEHLKRNSIPTVDTHLNNTNFLTAESQISPSIGVSKRFYASAMARYSAAATIFLIGFIAWNWMYQKDGHNSGTVISSSDKLENTTESNKLSIEKNTPFNNNSLTKQSKNKEFELKDHQPNRQASTSTLDLSHNHSVTKKDADLTHPLIAATENYHSSAAKMSLDNNDIYPVQNGPELSVNLKQPLANQPYTNVDETIITVLNTQKKSGKSKRQFMAYNVKEMMRKGQLPNIKIQPIKEEKVGLIPPFRFELDINQVPVYQTSNHQH